MSLAKFSVDFVARVTKFEQELKRTTAAAETTAARVQKAFGLVGRTVAGLGVGLSVGVVASWVRQTADLQREIQQLAAVAGTSTEVFSGMSFGAQRFGVQADKLADILKDTQDKLGDFLQNGAGPMADFFNNIAPRVGLTADAFRDLSGPQVLQKYYNALKQANLSQAETVFYMEAIASDATRLIPLLENNGAAFAEAAEQAQKFGVVVTDKSAAAAAEFDKNLIALQQSAGGAGMRIANDLIPWVSKLADEFMRGRDIGNGFLDSVITLGTINPFRSAASNLSVLRAQLEELEATLKNPPAYLIDTTGVESDIRRVQNQILFLEGQARAAIRNSITETGAENDPRRGRGYVAPPELPRPALPAPRGRGAVAAANLDGEFKKYLENLQRQLESTQELTAQETVLRDIQAGRLGTVTAAQQQELERTARLIDADRERRAEIDRTAEAAKARAAELDALLSGTSDVLTAKMREKLALLDDAFFKGEISVRQYDEAVQQLTGRASDVDKLKNAVGDFSQSFNSAFEDAILRGERLSKTLDALAADIARIVLRQTITQPLANAASAWLGSLLSFDGGGYTGNGPRSGGLDGKGGYLAMLHPQETVVDHTKGQRIAAPTMVYSPTFNFNGPADQALVLTAAQLGAQMGRSAVYDDMARGRV